MFTNFKGLNFENLSTQATKYRWATDSAKRGSSEHILYMEKIWNCTLLQVVQVVVLYSICQLCMQHNEKKVLPQFVSMEAIYLVLFGTIPHSIDPRKRTLLGVMYLRSPPFETITWIYFSISFWLTSVYLFFSSIPFASFLEHVDCHVLSKIQWKIWSIHESYYSRWLTAFKSVYWNRRIACY